MKQCHHTADIRCPNCQPQQPWVNPFQQPTPLGPYVPPTSIPPTSFPNGPTNYPPQLPSSHEELINKKLDRIIQLLEIISNRVSFLK